LEAGAGVDEPLPSVAASNCPLFFLRAMFKAADYAAFWVDVCSVVLPCGSEFPLAPTRGLCHAP
jgi:hypothetical protein